MEVASPPGKTPAVAARNHHPTHHHGVFRLRYGHPLPFGASLVPGGINFSVFSSHATSCTLVLFERDALRPFAEIPFPPEFRMGDVFAMMVFDLNPERIEYGYRMEGPFNPRAGHRFDRRHILLILSPVPLVDVRSLAGFRGRATSFRTVGEFRKTTSTGNTTGLSTFLFPN